MEVERDFVEMVIYEWIKDEYLGWGCFCMFLIFGVLDFFGGDVLRVLFGNFYWVGMEMVVEWKGYIEGVFWSGECVVVEVVIGFIYVNLCL